MKRILSILKFISTPVVYGIDLQSVEPRMEPLFPVSAEKRKPAGKVQALFDVDNTGSVTNVRILSSEPAGMFDAAVIDAMKKWKHVKRQASKNNVITIIFRPRPEQEIPEPNQPGRIQSRGVPFW